MSQTTREMLLPAGVLASLVLLWQLSKLTGLMPESVASPIEILAEFANNYELILYHAQPTLVAAFWGFVAAIIAALVLSFVVALVPQVQDIVFTGSVLIASIPLIALTPVLVLWLDRGSEVRITIAAIASFFPILIGAIKGIGQVREDHYDLLRIFAASRLQRVFFLQFPSALPLAISGIRAAAAGAILGAIVAEWSGGGGARGLGTLMSSALFSFNVPLAWLTITATILLSITTYFGVTLLTNPLMQRMQS